MKTRLFIKLGTRGQEHEIAQLHFVGVHFVDGHFHGQDRIFLQVKVTQNVANKLSRGLFI